MDQTDQLQLEIQLRQARKADIEKRILDHKNEVEQVKGGIESRAARGESQGNVPLDFLAIGDSWFEYPVNDDGLPSLNQAIPPHLEKMGNPPPKNPQPGAAWAGINRGAFVGKSAKDSGRSNRPQPDILD